MQSVIIRMCRVCSVSDWLLPGHTATWSKVHVVSFHPRGAERSVPVPGPGPGPVPDPGPVLVSCHVVSCIYIRLVHLRPEEKNRLGSHALRASYMNLV